MSKKVLSLVLALVMVLGSFSFVSAAAYPDVKGETAEAVDRLSTLGILEGYPDGTFKPEGQITRAEFAAVAVRAKGLKAVAAAAQGLPTGFSDVPGTFWASGVVGTAARLGIVNGVGNGLYAPQSPVKYEEAITMLVRALGYEAAAQAKGGYPYGYLIVANEIDLLEAVKGTQGVPATRGQVAQLTDNALEIPMMVQVGFGSTAKWVVSGSKEHGEDAIYLLDEMGFDVVEGRVVGINTKKNTLTVDAKAGKKTVEVAEGFDFYAVEGLRIKAWLNADEVIVFTAKDEAKFDAVKLDKDQLKLVGENTKYDVARDAYLELNGETVKADKFIADYAKVVVNSDDEIVWAEGFTFEGFIVVNEVKDDVIVDLNDDDLDVEDFLLVKDGKTIAVEDLEEADVVFYNADKDFTVVYNNSLEGKIERVYTESFKFEGKTYNNGNALYLDEDVLDVLNADILKAMMDEEKDVKVFFDFAGNVVLVVGETGDAKTSTYYAMMVRKSADITSANRTAKVTFDILNEQGKVVENNLNKSILGKDEAAQDALMEKLTAKSLVLVTVDEDGDITKVESLTKDGSITDAKKVKVDATYADGYRLQKSAVVFWGEGTDVAVKDYKVMTWEKAADEFATVEAADVYAVSGRVVALVITKTDADNKTADHTGLVTNVVELRTKGTWEITVEVNGTKTTYLTDGTLKFDDVEGVTTETKMADLKNKIVTVKVGDKSNKITRVVIEAGIKAKVDTINTSRKTIETVSGSVYELVDAVIYDTDFSKISLRDLEAGDEITVHKVNEDTTRFVSYVLRTKLAPEVDAPDNTKTYVYKPLSKIDGNQYVELDGVAYAYVGAAELPAAGNVKALFNTIRGEVVVTTITPVL